MNLYKTINLKFLNISILSLLFLSIMPLQAGKVDTLFVSDEIIKMELRSDFSAIQDERNDTPQYHKGELIYFTSGSEPVKLSVKVMARGNFRLKPVNCGFPPLFLNFRKNEVKNTIFADQDRLKLVTPCQSEEDVIDEYTIYKMYNQVTDLSLKVRLVNIVYFDTNLNKKLFEKHSFFIEDKDHAAERNDAIEKDMVVTPFDLNRDNLIKLAFFQYIIGNKDWYISSRKNITIMLPKDQSQAPSAVPFDFDFSALVNASYTKPHGIPEEFLAKRRIYKGICYSDSELEDVFIFYKGLKPVFESIIKSQKLISAYNRRQILSYLDSFYEVIEDRDLIKKEFLEACETRATYNISD